MPKTAARTDQKAVVKALLRRHGTTFAEELGIDVAKNTPSPLFRLLCLSLLLSARIRGSIAIDAARALAKDGLTTAEKTAGASWERRTRVLNESGYARYDERTSTMLGDTANLLLDRYGGDLRKLRDAADRDPARERALLKELKGIGDAGVDIFFREVQGAWGEVAPFADRRALVAAAKLGLGDDAEALARHVRGKDLPRLVAALVRMDVADDHEEVLADAS
jgi:endonuclease III